MPTVPSCRFFMPCHSLFPLPFSIASTHSQAFLPRPSSCRLHGDPLPPHTCFPCQSSGITQDSTSSNAWTLARTRGSTLREPGAGRGWHRGGTRGWPGHRAVFAQRRETDTPQHTCAHTHMHVHTHQEVMDVTEMDRKPTSSGVRNKQKQNKALAFRWRAVSGAARA